VIGSGSKELQRGTADPVRFGIEGLLGGGEVGEKNLSCTLRLEILPLVFLSWK